MSNSTKLSLHVASEATNFRIQLQIRSYDTIAVIAFTPLFGPGTHLRQILQLLALVTPHASLLLSLSHLTVRADSTV